eukprot:g26781.t1
MLQTDFGLKLQYDGNHFVKITVPSSYNNQMCGLCGDFNGDYIDDYQKPDGALAVNDTVFGDSWKTKDDEDEKLGHENISTVRRVKTVRQSKDAQ